MSETRGIVLEPHQPVLEETHSCAVVLVGGTVDDALDLMVERHLITAEARAEAGARLSEQSDLVVPLGPVVALAHVRVEDVTRPHVALIVDPRDLDARHAMVFVLISPTAASDWHIEALSELARCAADTAFTSEALSAASADELVAAVDHYVHRRVAPPPSSELTRSGRLFGGIAADVARRAPRYVSDFKDGLKARSLATILFLFFACFAPAVAFGGMMSDATEGAIGAVEMIVATAACGVVYALVAGQPLTILGGTGPLLVFTTMLFQLCKSLGVPFLPMYAWVGIWTGVITVIFAATDASALIRFFTRFTDEIFAALISIIFIVQSVHDVLHPLATGSRPQASAILVLFLALATFQVMRSLTRMRHGAYLRSWMRDFLADFGPAITMGVMSLVPIAMHEIPVPTLPVPEGFSTTSGRPWLVDLFAGPRWIPFAAIVPALLCSVLLYLDQNITARIVNGPGHSLKKGAAYHLDLAVVGVLVGGCSVFGLPWLVAATVRSINHVRALATLRQVTLPDGSTRERIVAVSETRVTGLGIHLLVGLALLALPLLSSLPMAVLYGLFFYMGVTSLRGNQLFDRLKLWITDPERFPRHAYVRLVPRRVLHRFTAVQVVALVVLWIVKASAIGLLFPLFIALLAPLRRMLGRFFAREHLERLDAEEESSEEETEEIG